MEAVKKISLPEWVCSKQVKKLMHLIGGCEDDPHSLLVGGCVRNAVLQTIETDIDIATQFTPEEIISKLDEEAIKVVPTGIDHGTVMAVVDGKSFEITTLRKDVLTDGRHAEVSFTDDWLEDAKRRDFTMNSLFADMRGNIYDPLETGLKDLEEGKVVFVGDPSKRIEEDYLRILRFFRFYAIYGEGASDKEALGACAQAADKISTLSRERITQEFLKILAVPHVSNVLKLMFDHGILKELPDDHCDLELLQKLSDLQVKHDVVNVVSRLLVLAGNKAKLFDDYLRLSHAQKNFLIKLDMVVHSSFYHDDKELKKAIFYHGNELLLQGCLYSIAMNDVEENVDMISLAMNWQAPKCPITGEMLLTEGYQTGPELGQELERRQQEWLEENL